MGKKSWTVLAVLLVLGVLVYTQITIFVVQPIGAVPEGRTLVLLRGANTEFIDSADAMCERVQGNVNLLCRLAAMGAVVNNSTILLRLPYSQTLYDISTGGERYDR